MKGAAKSSPFFVLKQKKMGMIEVLEKSVSLQAQKKGNKKFKIKSLTN